MEREARLHRDLPPVHTWACHFLQKPPAPLKVGTPLSALTPAPVMMAMCFALANTSRKSAISVCEEEKQTAGQACFYIRSHTVLANLCIQKRLPCTPPMTLVSEY